jgi:hypothetical protein
MSIPTFLYINHQTNTMVHLRSHHMEIWMIRPRLDRLVLKVSVDYRSNFMLELVTDAGVIQW